MNQNNIERRVFSSPIEVRETGEGESRKIVGYAAVYSRQSEDLGFIETIEPGAFDGADTTDVRALINHDADKILGRTSSGTLIVNIDENGLRYQLDAPDTTYANDLLVSMKRGDITQSSFAFAGVEDIWEERDGKTYRTIKKIRTVYDVSPVTYPAYPDASVALRSLEQFKEENKPTPQLAEDKDLDYRFAAIRALV